MSFSGDIKTIRVADAETPTDSVPARIRAVSIFSNGQGTTRFTITDNGTTVFDVDVASGAYQYFDLPDLGIPCRNDLTISTADNLAEATIFYTGEVDLTAYTGESEGSLRPAINLGLETGTLTPVTGSVTPTYTRATERVMPDYQGILRTVPSGAFTPGGFRVVENLMNLVSGANSEDMTSTGFSTTSGVTVDSATQVTYDGTGGFQSVKFATGFAPANTSLEYIFHVKIRVVSGSPSGSDVLIEIGNGADVSKSVGDDISGTEAWVSYGPDNHDGAGNFELRVLFANTACTLEVTEWMLEDVTGQVNQAPSEYVSVGQLSTPFHGTGADGVKYFTTYNANTVSSNVVTAGTGAAITADNNSFACIWQEGDHYSQADSAANSFESDFAGWVCVAPDSWSDGDQDLVRKWTTGSQEAYIVRLASGSVELILSEDGSSHTVSTASTSAVPFSDGEIGWVGWFWGDSANEVTFYTASLPQAATLAELDSAKETLGTAAQTLTSDGIFDSSDVLVLGGQDDSPQFSQFYGRYYRAYLGSSLTTADVTFDANDTTGWTANGNAYIYTPNALGYIPYPSVENLHTYSEDLSNAAWTKGNATITTDQITAPDGTATADVLGDDGSTGTGQVFFYDNISVTSSAKVTICVWYKSKQLSLARLGTGGNFTSGNTYFDLDAATTLTQSGSHDFATVEQYPDGWVRCGITFTAPAGSGDAYYLIAESDGVTTVDLDGTSDVYVWGAMAVDNWDLETQGFPPYVPTVASTVTHNADDSDNTGAAFDATTGTLFATVRTGAVVADGVIAQLDDDSASDIVKLEIVSGALTATITSAAGDDVSITGSALSADTEYDIALAWAADDAELYLDGASAGTDATLDPPSVTLTNLRSGVDEAVGSQPGLLVQDVKVYTSRLTTAQVQSEITYSALPLDGIDAVLAFSAARKLSNAYGGPSIVVRESGGDDELGIPFTATNVLDESALTTHTGANNGLIATAYGQGSANNLTQTTAADQPQIVASGTINTLNGKPAPVFSSSQLVTSSGLVDCTGGICVAAVIEPDALPASNRMIVGCVYFSGSRFTLNTNGTTIVARIFDDSDKKWIARKTDVSAVTTGTPYVVHFTYDGGTTASSIKIYINGVQSDTTDDDNGSFVAPSGAAGSGPIQVGGIPSAYFAGHIAEAVVVLDSDIGNIPSNMMSFYGIS